MGATNVDACKQANPTYNVMSIFVCTGQILQSFSAYTLPGKTFRLTISILRTSCSRVSSGSMPPHWCRSNSTKLLLLGKLYVIHILGQWRSYDNWLLTASKHCHRCLLDRVNKKFLQLSRKNAGEICVMVCCNHRNSARACTSTVVMAAIRQCGFELLHHLSHFVDLYIWLTHVMIFGRFTLWEDIWECWKCHLYQKRLVWTAEWNLLRGWC